MALYAFVREQARQGGLSIDEMCWMGAVSRVGYYRRWRASKPREEETALRDRLQNLALAHRHYGYRRIGVLLRRERWQANHKRVLRILRADNLLCLRRRAFVPTRKMQLQRHTGRPARGDLANKLCALLSRAKFATWWMSALSSLPGIELKTRSRPLRKKMPA